MKKQTLLGTLIIVAGLIIFLSNAEIGSVRAILTDWWPIFLIVSGLYMLWVNVRNFVWPTILMFIGAVLLLDSFDIGKVDISAIFIPTILIGIGLSIIVGSIGGHKKEVSEPDDSIVAILGASTSKNTSKNFSGASVNAFMGGVEFDISKAVIKKPVILNVTIIMGGLELRIPENVKVINRTQSVLGGVEDNTVPIDSESDQVLVIQGLILMGGIEIKR